MGAEIKDGNGGTDQLGIDPVSKAARVTFYDTTGAPLNTLPVKIDQTTPGTTNRVDIADSLNNSLLSTPYGKLQVELNPHQLFYDPFDATLDATDRWTTPTVGNSAVLASNTAGSMVIGTGTTASGWSKLTSQNAFMPTVPGWIGFSFLNLFPDLAAPIANSYRFWGAGTIASVPTTAAPMTDAVGFEIGTTGKMFAVIYTAGVRTSVQDLSAATGNAKQPTDALLHRYIVKVRTDRVYFYIDGESSSTLVATFSATTATSGPSVQTLPISFLAVGGVTPPATNAQMQSVGAVVWDASQNNSTLSDGLFQWRKATIKRASAPLLITDNVLVTLSVPSDGVKATYGAGALDTVPVAAGATDVFTIAGSATKTIRILRVFFSGTRTASTSTNVTFLKRSTANTGGVSVALSAVPFDSNNVAATATVLAYTANPVVGTLVGNIRNKKILIPAPGVIGDTLEYDFGSLGQTIVLRGVGQVMAISFNGVAIVGGLFNFGIEWIEE